jgi:flagellar basal-body rod modification protein FlgD
MTVGATTTNPTTSTTNSSSSTTTGADQLATSFNTFLTLLTTQMKNQDPTSPMDSTQFTQQLVQMTGVEQQLQTNDLLKQLVGNTSSGISAAVSLIGKDVRAATDTAALANGQAKWTYALDTAANDTKIEVLDANGTVVHAEEATDNKAGDHSFTWDGKGPSGNKLPDGTYTLRVTASAANGAAVNSTTYVQGVVTSVEQANGTTMITINGGQVPWDQVTSITQPAATASNSNTDGQTPSSAAA